MQAIKGCQEKKKYKNVIIACIEVFILKSAVRRKKKSRPQSRPVAFYVTREEKEIKHEPSQVPHQFLLCVV